MHPKHLASLLIAAAAFAAHAGTPDIPDDINARLARAKSQTAADAQARARAAAASFNGVAAIDGAGGSATTGAALGKGCNIAIGNVVEDRRPGVSTSARRETTVIVTGDVIQVGNNCR